MGVASEQISFRSLNRRGESWIFDMPNLEKNPLPTPPSNPRNSAPTLHHIRASDEALGCIRRRRKSSHPTMPTDKFSDEHLFATLFHRQDHHPFSSTETKPHKWHSSVPPPPLWMPLRPRPETVTRTPTSASGSTPTRAPTAVRHLLQLVPSRRRRLCAARRPRRRRKARGGGG